ncbi:MAG TPA: protein-disulfide reductase DsbD domain-containing protein, partial [Caulifigura sp.]|nr:protein-disulfide reductase DsbD domain-containing protein [Caulifigura sp.]
YTAAAERAAMFILTQMRDAEGRLKRTYCEGQASNAACLDDYAFLIDGLVALNEVTGDDKWLNAARRLMDDEIEQFWDDRSGGFFYTADHHEPLLARMKDGYDSVMPSGNSVSVDVLGRLARVTKSNAYQGRAEKTLATFGSQIEQSPSGFSRMLLGAEAVLRPAQEVAAAPMPESLIAANAPPKPKLTPEKAPAAPPQAADKLEIFAQPAQVEAAKHQYVKGRIYLSTDKLTPGTSTKIAVVLDISEGWHVNANPAKPDFVLPAEFSLESAAGIELTDLVYPAGKDMKMEAQEEPVSVYEGQAVIRGVLKVPQNAKPGSDDLKFTLRYQACDHMKCLAPKKMKIDGKAEIGAGAKAINSRVFPEAK